MSDRPSAFAKLKEIQPRASEPIGSKVEEKIETIAKARGFLDDRPVPERALRKNRASKSPATISATMRVEVDDWNAFVDWCDRSRLTYKEAFQELLQKAQIK